MVSTKANDARCTLHELLKSPGPIRRMVKRLEVLESLEGPSTMECVGGCWDRRGLRM